MNSTFYKRCAVPQRKSSSIKRPKLPNAEETAWSRSVQRIVEEVPQLTPNVLDKSTQVNIYKKVRSKANQTKVSLGHQTTSPSKPFLNVISTSPFKVEQNVDIYPSSSSEILKKIEPSDSDTSYTQSLISIKPLQMESTSDCNETLEDKRREHLNALQCTLKKIKKDPCLYIGIQLSCYFLVNLIHEEINIPTEHILLCLNKIKLHKSFRELADDFGIDRNHASEIFFKNVPIIASVMRPFIVSLDKELIIKRLPIAFRHKYSHVTCLIDCLEIEIQKPSKASHQALCWSDNKKANTIKYLVSCTPNGLVNYISCGYGGLITDSCIVETCDFSKCLQPDMCILADKGFGNAEVYLKKMGVLLLRPKSVTSGAELTKAEAEKTKEIAGLLVYVERVMRRLREFEMLEPHACLNSSLVKVLDDVVTIACGLVNLKDSLY